MSILFVLALGCAPEEEENGAEELIASLEHELGELDEAVEAHVTEIGGAADVAAVATLNTDHAEAVDAIVEEFHHALEEIEGCEMGGASAGLMVDAHAGMETIEEALDELVTGHDAHADVEECGDAVDAYATAMTDATAAMRGHADAWHADEEMHCAAHGGDDGHEEEEGH